MGLFSKDERVIRPADSKGHGTDNSRPTMHGSKGEFRLMSGMGSFTRWGRTSDRSEWNVKVTGEKPGGGRQR